MEFESFDFGSLEFDSLEFESFDSIRDSMRSFRMLSNHSLSMEAILLCVQFHS